MVKSLLVQRTRDDIRGYRPDCLCRNMSSFAPIYCQCCHRVTSLSLVHSAWIIQAISDERSCSKGDNPKCRRGLGRLCRTTASQHVLTLLNILPVDAPEKHG